MLSIIPFTSEMMTGVFGYVIDLFDALKYLILLIFGIALGFWIIEEVFESLTELKMKRIEEAKIEEQAMAEILGPFKAHEKARKKREAREDIVQEA